VAISWKNTMPNSVGTMAHGKNGVHSGAKKKSSARARILAYMMVDIIS